MARRVSLDDAQAHLADLLEVVGSGKEPVIVEDEGADLAVVISPDEFERYSAWARRELFGLVDEIQRRNEDEDPEEILREVTSVVEEVRQSAYEQRRSAKDGR